MGKNIDEELKKLESIGYTKIYEDTLVSKEFIQLCLTKDVGKIAPVKLNGFIKILENEYDLDLSGIHEELKKIQEEAIIEKNEDNQKQNSGESSLIFYGVLSALILIMVYVISVNSSKSEEESGNSDIQTSIQAEDVTEDTIIETPVIEDVTQNIAEEKIVEATEDIKVDIQEQKIEKTIIKDIVKVEKQISSIKQKIIIAPSTASSVWIGVINLTTNKKRQYTLTEEKEFMLENEMLIVTAHSQVKFNFKNQDFKYSEAGSLYFNYKNSQLLKITKEEYLQLNKGKEW